MPRTDPNRLQNVTPDPPPAVQAFLQSTPEKVFIVRQRVNSRRYRVYDGKTLIGYLLQDDQDFWCPCTINDTPLERSRQIKDLTAAHRRFRALYRAFQFLLA